MADRIASFSVSSIEVIESWSKVAQKIQILRSWEILRNFENCLDFWIGNYNIWIQCSRKILLFIKYKSPNIKHLNLINFLISKFYIFLPIFSCFFKESYNFWKFVRFKKNINHKYYWIFFFNLDLLDGCNIFINLISKFTKCSWLETCFYWKGSNIPKIFFVKFLAKKCK